MVALLALCYWVLSNEAARPQHIYEPQHVQKDSLGLDSINGRSRSTRLTKATFAYYCLLIHVLVFIFPVRACWAIWDLTRSLKKVRAKSLRELKFLRRGSSTSLSSSETLTSTSSAAASSRNSEAGDLEAELYDAESGHIVHAIIIPNYKEELDTLRETLDVLASHTQACVSYDVSQSSHIPVRKQVFLLWSHPIGAVSRSGVSCMPRNLPPLSVQLKPYVRELG